MSWGFLLRNSVFSKIKDSNTLSLWILSASASSFFNLTSSSCSGSTPAYLKFEDSWKELLADCGRAMLARFGVWGCSQPAVGGISCIRSWLHDPLFPGDTWSWQEAGTLKTQFDLLEAPAVWLVILQGRFPIGCTDRNLILRTRNLVFVHRFNKKSRTHYSSLSNYLGCHTNWALILCFL